jgi:nitrite reductase/ring-hydroxylating ferredoxin subunit
MPAAATDSHLRLSGHALGWYALAFASELRAGTVLRRRLMNQELVVFRTASGVPVVLDGYCPHLGAHLGEGGKVVGEQLRCPFHDLGFAPDGRCAHSPYGQAPPRLSTRSWPVRELHGVLLVYSDPSAAPSWEVKPVEDDNARLEWSQPAGRLWRIRTHPQEIIENTVDVGHFRAVHGYESIEVTEAMKADGPHLTMSYTVTRDRGLLGKYDPGRPRFRLDINASGVGYSRVQVSGLPVRLRTVVMPTPVDDEITEVRVITQVAVFPGKAHWAARLLPRQWIADCAAQLAAREMGRDFAADLRIWEHKRYQDPPRLVAGDGPIGPYRRWARQFYRETTGTRSARLAVAGEKA